MVSDSGLQFSKSVLIQHMVLMSSQLMLELKDAIHGEHIVRCWKLETTNTTSIAVKIFRLVHC